MAIAQALSLIHISIGASYPFEDPVAIVYNDDGKLMGLPLNLSLIHI